MSEVRTDLVVNVKGTAAAGMKDLATRTAEAADATRQLRVEQQRVGSAGGGIGATLGGLGESVRSRQSTFQSTSDKIFNEAINKSKENQAKAAQDAASGNDLFGGIKIGIAAQQLTVGLSGLAKSFDALGNAELRTEQKTRAIAESIPFLGQAAAAFFSFQDAVGGTTNIIRALNREMQIQAAVHQADLQALQATRAEQTAQRSRVLAAGAAAANAGIQFALPRFGETLADRQRFQDESRLLPARRAVVETRFQEQGFGEESLRTRATIDQLEARLDAQQRERDTFLNAAKAPGLSQTQQAGLAQSAQTRNLEIQKTTVDLQAQYNALKETEQRQFDAGTAARKAQVDLDRQQLDLLKEREQRTTGLLQSFGGLNAAEKQLAVQFARQLQQHGLESLTESQRALIARAGGGQALSLAQEQAGRRNPLTAQFADLVGQPLGDVNAMREQIRAATLGIDKQISINSAELTKQFSDVMQKIADRIIALVGTAAKEAERRVTTQAIIANAQRGGAI